MLSVPVSPFLGNGLENLRPGDDDDPETLRKVAAEFESLLVAQMLRAMRESSAAGWLGTGDDEAGTTMVEVAEEQFARALAAQGGLGLADLIVAGLRKANAAPVKKTPPGGR